jgi:hypothetical protein
VISATKPLFLAGGLIMAGLPAFAQEASDCLVTEAAQAALDRQLAIIESSAVDVEDIFSGPDSCINADIMNSFDLSNLIIDPMSWVSGSVTDALTDAISDAKTQVCEAIQDKIDDTVGSVSSAISDHSSTLSGELDGILQSGWDGMGI